MPHTLGSLNGFTGGSAAGTVWRTEVPLPIPGDRRAWDGVAILLGRTAGCELEMRLGTSRRSNAGSPQAAGW